MYNKRNINYHYTFTDSEVLLYLSRGTHNDSILVMFALLPLRIIRTQDYVERTTAVLFELNLLIAH